MLRSSIENLIDEVTGLLQEARELVFIVVAFGAVIFTAVGILSSEDFMKLALMVFAFYFAKKTEVAVG